MKSKASENRQIKLGAMISYFSIAFGIISGFIYTPWMVRQIGQSDYGLFTLATSVISFFLMDFGISGAISRFISVYRAKDEEEKVAELLGVTYKLYLRIDIAIFVILTVVFCLMQNIFLQLSSQEIQKFRVVYVIVGLFSLVSFPLMPLNGILIAYEKFILLRFCDLAQKILSIGLVVIALLSGFGLYVLVFVNVLVNLGLSVVKLTYLKRKVRVHIAFRSKNRELLKKILGFSVWVTVISISQRLILNIIPSVLGMFYGTVQISVFSIGMVLEGYTWTFTSALNGLFLPKVARMSVKEQSMEQITDLMIKVGRIQMAVVGIIWIGLFFMGKEFIVLWMGENFRDSYYVALFLIVPGVITLTQEIANSYLVAINEVKYRAMVYIGTAVVSIALSLIFTPLFGAVGAALATGIGTIVGHVIVMNILYYKVFHLNIPLFFCECHLKMMVPFALTAGFALLLQRMLPVSSLILFIGKAGLVGVAYVVLLGLFGLNTYEKNLFRSILHPSKKAS